MTNNETHKRSRSIANCGVRSGPRSFSSVIGRAERCQSRNGFGTRGIIIKTHTHAYIYTRSIEFRTKYRRRRRRRWHRHAAAARARRRLEPTRDTLAP
jgi:hypothetical protein